MANVSITRPARMFRVPAETEWNDWVAEQSVKLQYGDLLVFDRTWICDRLVGVYDGTTEIHVLAHATAEVVRIHRHITDRFPDALAHYRALLDAEAHEPRRRIFLEVHPRDAGLRTICGPISVADEMLQKQWYSITVTVVDAKWHIHNVDFGVSDDVFSLDSLDREFPPMPVERAVAAKRTNALDLAPVYEFYRNSLKTAKRCFLGSTDRDAFHRLFGEDLSAFLAPYAWDVIAQHTVTINEDRHVVVYISGPPCNLDVDWVARALSFAGTTETGRPETYIIDIDNPGLQTHLLYRFKHAFRHCNLTPRRHEWRTVHGFVLDRVLALAPLGLTPYIVLWILELLPECRHHIHIQLFRLIESITASVRQVRRKRAGQ